VGIVRPVASLAIGRQFVGQRADVTVGALKLCVGAGQRETGLGKMVECERPLPLIVTTLAVGAVAAEMHVVAAVTTDAIIGGLIQAHVGQVAVAARQIGMGAEQSEAGLAFVLEVGVRPVAFGVAVAAFVAAATAVNVVGPMTVDTFLRCRLVDLIDVAGTALGLGVLAQQRKVGLIVVELGVAPQPDAVTAAAVAAQIRPVHVVALVAADAFVGCFEVRCIGMTRLARRIGVRAFEREVGERVVEQLRNQADDIRVPAPMLRVAGAAFVARRLGLGRMESLSRLQVLGDPLVTVQTECSLLRAAERGVTFTALVFDFLVARDDRPGHHQPFQRGRPGGRGRQQCREQCNPP